MGKLVTIIDGVCMGTMDGAYIGALEGTYMGELDDFEVGIGTEQLFEQPELLNDEQVDEELHQ